MNILIIIGRLVSNPEIRFTKTGKAIASFTVAANRDIVVEGQPKVDFIPVVAWNKLGEACGDNIAKGNLVAVEGRLQIRSYIGEDTKKHYVTELIASRVKFLEKRKQSIGTTEVQAGPDDNGAEEDIPF